MGKFLRLSFRRLCGILVFIISLPACLRNEKFEAFSLFMDFHKNAEKTSEKTGQCARESEDRRPAAEANSPKERKMLGEIDEGGETRHRRGLCFLHNQGLPKEVIFCYNTNTERRSFKNAAERSHIQLFAGSEDPLSRHQKLDRLPEF